MLKTLACITVDHDLRLVVLAGLVCFLACFTAIELVSRARSAQGREQVLWIAGAGSVAGGGVWATHFVAMLAYQSSLPITYDVALTTLSILASISLAIVGIAVALRSGSGLLGGAVVGVAIATMHYIGMAALRGPVEVSWDASYVTASLIVGVVLSAIAFSLAVRGRSLKDTALAAGVLTLAICALHFTAMTAVTLTPIATLSVEGVAFEPVSLAVAVAAIQMLIIGLGLTGMMADRHQVQRAVAARLRAHVSELEEASRKLETTQGKLVAALDLAAQSSEAKSQFLASMSHELRTPLNAIIGYSELIGLEPYGPLGDARYLEYTGDIRASGAHLLSLVNDVLDLARLDANRVELENETVDLPELVDETLRLVAPQATRAWLKLEHRLPENPPQVRADRRRIKQVLINLLSNAVKFTPAGGTVTLSVDVTGDGLALAVSDTGVGMRPEDIPVALDRFGQIEGVLARKHQGTGLGLPLVKELIELHGGHLTVESTLGEGTTVTAILPRERVLECASEGFWRRRTERSGEDLVSGARA